MSRRFSFYLLAQAWQSLRKSPNFIAAVVISIGLTTGALLSILTLAYHVFFKPLPYPDQERLVTVNYQRFDQSSVLKTEKFVYPAAGLIQRALQQQTDAPLGDSALLYYAEEVVTSITTQPKLATTYVSTNWLSILATPMAVGNVFAEQGELNQYIPAAILSYKTWQEHYGGQTDILTQHIVINGISHPVIGVTAQDFVEPQLYESGRDSQIWLPWDYNNSEFKSAWNFVDHRLFMVAKLQNNNSLQQAASFLTLLNNDISVEQTNEQAFYREWRVGFKLTSFKDELTLESRGTILLLFLGVLGLLLIAIVNITNLFLARTVAQQRNLAIHAFLGASRQQLIGNLFMEILLLMFWAMLLSLLVAQFGFTLMHTYFIDNLPRVNELELSTFTLVAAFIIGILLAYLFSVFSAQTIRYKTLNASMQSSGKGTGVQVSQKSQKWLVCSQIAIALLLIFANGLLLNDAMKQLKKPVGFNAEQLLTVDFSISTLDWLGWDAYAPRVQELEQKLLALPQVNAVSFARTPLDDRLQYPVVDVKTNQQYYSLFRNVDHHYFNVMQQRVIQGDSFSKSDVNEQSPVLLVNKRFADMLAENGERVIGRKLLFGNEQSTIIGIVENLNLPNYRQTPPRVYVTNLGTATFMLIKLQENQQLTREQMIAVLAATDKQFVLSQFERVTDSMSQAVFGYTLIMNITFILALLTVFIAGIGLYGILSYSTQMRRFEIGTRLAIGAKGTDVIKLIINNNISAIVIGVIASIVILTTISLVFHEQLENYLNWQLLPIFLLALGLICIISFFACYLPLRQYINKPALYSLQGSD